MLTSISPATATPRHACQSVKTAALLWCDAMNLERNISISIWHLAFVNQARTQSTNCIKRMTGKLELKIFFFSILWVLSSFVRRLRIHCHCWVINPRVRKGSLMVSFGSSSIRCIKNAGRECSRIYSISKLTNQLPNFSFPMNSLVWATAPRGNCDG